MKILIMLAPLLALIAGCEPEWSRVDDSVIRLGTETGKGVATGSAFSINDQGHYGTNHHVIEAALAGAPLFAVESVSPAKKLHPVSVVWHSKEKDLAVVLVADWKRPPMILADDRTVKKNQPVVTIGFPGASDFTRNNPGFTEPKIKRGVISARQSFPFIENAGPVDLFEHDATVNGGNSGGPLVDDCGRVVGINVAKALTHIDAEDFLAGAPSGAIPVDIQEGTFLSIRVNELRTILDAEKIPYSRSAELCEAPIVRFRRWEIGIAAFILLALTALTLAYFRLRRLAPEGRVDSRFISRLIREKIGKGSEPEKIHPGGRPVIRGPGGEIIKIGENDQTPIQGEGVAAGSFCLRSTQNWPDIRLLPGESPSLGRDPNLADIVINHPDISRRHAQLRVSQQGEPQVIDLDSMNGTFLDHTRVGSENWLSIAADQRLILSGEDIVYQLVTGED